MSEGHGSVVKNIVLGIIIGAALVASAWILSGGFKTIAKPDRIVSVKGLAEREVDADLAIWPLTFSLGDDNIQTLQQSIISKTAIAKTYLLKYGLAESDFTVQAPSITDTSLEVFQSNKPKYNYVAEEVILVRSNKIAAVKNAQEHSLELMGDDILVSQGYNSNVVYEFTRLNDIKPDMIGEATKNARVAADQFARDSGSTVGKILRASQGIFSIENAATGLEEKKKIRVITSVDYFLVD
ncbi:MAG: SIMPL domain-containing protein [Proteobacteria bacterium]|nr:SIMPL domain-containing protein [Pseudomonadota bacterium]